MTNYKNDLSRKLKEDEKVAFINQSIKIPAFYLFCLEMTETFPYFINIKKVGHISFLFTIEATL